LPNQVAGHSFPCGSCVNIERSASADPKIAE
jgi:hypothetical protein